MTTWIFHKLEAFICKALKGEAIVCYCEPLITQQMDASGLCKIQVLHQRHGRRPGQFDNILGKDSARDHPENQ